MMVASSLWRFSFVTLFSLLLSSAVHAQQGKHKIIFTFDYDFSRVPPCSDKVTQGCVQQFNFYDISAGTAKRFRLASKVAPPKAKGLAKGISVTTDSFLFNSGTHRFAATAQMADGSESDLSSCLAIAQIP